MSSVGRVARSESRYLRRKKLGGTQAADLPFVEPIKLEFAVNLTGREDARPRNSSTLLALADEVIE